MKKLILFSSIFMFFVIIFPISAQMMEGSEEIKGKAVWDRLQNNEISCEDLKSEDFEVMGDFFMGSMMGENHSYMDQMMNQRLGEEGNTEMHIAMGKRLSGCDTNALFPKGASYFMPMMGMMGGATVKSSFAPWSYGGMKIGGYDMMGNFNLLGSIILILIIIFLVSGIVYFWKGINKR